ncbi:MAG: hypothetical protein V4612_02015 [Pseudomonadota bacterium]
MKKLILLISLISTVSCTNQKAIDAKAREKARHQAETGSRINDASKDTGGLFDEMQ